MISTAEVVKIVMGNQNLRVNEEEKR